MPTFTSSHFSPDVFFQTSPSLCRGMTVQLGCKQGDFCYGCYHNTYGWVSISHVDVRPTFHYSSRPTAGSLWSHETGTKCLRSHFSLDTTGRMLRGQLSGCEGHATFWLHDRTQMSNNCRVLFLLKEIYFFICSSVSLCFSQYNT